MAPVHLDNLRELDSLKATNGTIIFSWASVGWRVGFVIPGGKTLS